MMKDINDLLNALNIDTLDDLITFLQGYYDNKGYEWLDEQIIGLRTDDVYTDYYTDWFVVIKGTTIIAITGTTKPGSLKAGKGGACVVEGQYKNLWYIGNTQWSGLPYLQQKSVISIYRDSSKLDHIDRNSPVETTANPLPGINFHSWINIGEVGKIYNVSEGCQCEEPQENSAAFAVIKTFDDQMNITYILIFVPDFISYCQNNQENS
jgi:hypothetical protein